MKLYVTEGKSTAENHKAGLVNKPLEYFELYKVDPLPIHPPLIQRTQAKPLLV